MTVRYTFDAFRDDIRSRVRLLNRRLRDPAATWPGVLLLDLPEAGLSAEAFILDGLDRDGLRELAEETLPTAIRLAGARRFCWVMPVLRWSGDESLECLMLVLGERGRLEVSYAEVIRDGGPPRLGLWNDGAFGRGARRATGVFVEPLLAALERLRR